MPVYQVRGGVVVGAWPGLQSPGGAVVLVGSRLQHGRLSERECESAATKRNSKLCNFTPYVYPLLSCE